MGFSADRDGLMTRYLNEAENWKAHLEHTTNFILKSAQNKAKGTCVVLGSGWWLDVPTEELSKIFNKLILIDIVHSAQIKHKAKKYPNITLIDADLTESLQGIYSKVKSKKFTELSSAVPYFTNFGLAPDFEADFYVSPNVLSQLGGLVSEFLQKNKKVSGLDISDLKQKIEESHLRSLPSGKSCIIVDYKENIINTKTGATTTNARVEANLPAGNFNEEWIWDFDLNGNYLPNSHVRFQVRGLDF